MNRLALVVLLFVSGCRCGKVWPADEVTALAERCPETFGDARGCECYAKEISQRVPWDVSNKVFSDQRHAARFSMDAFSACADGASLTTWPAKLRENFTAKCGEHHLPPATCTCLVDLAQQKIPPEMWIAASLSTQAGKPLPEEAAALFEGDDAGECVARDTKWDTTYREKVITGCKANEPVEGYCECFVDATMVEVTPLDMYLQSKGRDDGGVALRTSAITAACLNKLKRK